MLEKLVIQNYQGLKLLELELDSEVTTIVGPNDAGKSAALRALRWVCLNDPTSGDTRHGASLSRVTLTVKGHKVTRKRGKHNVYKLDGQVYKAFRSDVPAAIQKLLNVSDINFQPQLAPHFWLSLSPPQVGRELNQIVNLGIIDSSLKWIASKAKKVKAEVELIESRIEEAEEQKKSLAWTIRANDELLELEAKQATLAAKATATTQLESILGEVQAAKQSQELLSQATLEGQKLVKAGRSLLETTERVKRLQKLLEANIRAAELQSIKLPNLQPHQLQVEMLEHVDSSIHKLEAFIQTYEEQENELCQVQERLKSGQRKLEREAKTLKRCPLCGTPLSQSLALTCTSPKSHQ